jgi:Domain of unknown function (DUF4326)
MSVTPQRVQLRRANGWRMPPDTIRVARPGLWGNPYPVALFGLDRALRLFENTVTGCWSPGLFGDSEPDALVHKAYKLHLAFGTRHHYRVDLRPLSGRHLACWCSLDKPCHADALLRLANER